MSRESSSDLAGDETARTVGKLVKYSREMNQSRTVGEVGSYALEAAHQVMEGDPSTTVTEVRDGDLRVLESMVNGLETGDDPDTRSAQAYHSGKTVVAAPSGTALAVETGDLAVERDATSSVTIATSSLIRKDHGVVVTGTWSALETVDESHLKPLEFLADHVATAVTNIRDRQRLERARNDLETRKEMIKMYDRILRHDLGNDLQVISGFSDALVGTIEEDQESLRYAEKIQQTARSAADLVRRVGEIVHTLEEDAGPRVRELPAVLTPVIDEVVTTYDDLTVDYDPGDVDYQVYAGDLLESVFRNVLSNAAVHNEGPVTVRVYSEEPGPERVIVGFADDGSGVDSDLRDDMFELGEKGPDSEGSGLGLGFARALTEAYGGGIDLRESEAGGADFGVLLERP
ncbi:MAG: HAMP domain-containing sensor histidine kinase [Haloarculaceae archaeon]